MSHSAYRSDSPPRRRNGRCLRLSIVAAALVCVLTAGCHRAANAKADKVLEVVVTTPISDEVTDYQDFTGRLETVKTVDIRPRVSGYVTEAPFHEGDVVHKGELLFQIDPRTYEADLHQAEANLKQAEADRKLQIKNTVRAQQLIGEGNISKEEYDQVLANREKAAATVGAMAAARDRAKLFLEYTHVTAPLSGRVSRRLIDPGNLVNADNTVLTTIVTEDPMYAYFDVDERTYLELASAATTGTSSWFSSLSFPVLMRLANEEEFTQKGYVNFLDNRLNANTGTVRMRGEFTNATGYLKSGLFVRIRLPLGIPYKTLLIPDEALLSDQGRKYVFVVKTEKDDTDKEVERVKYRSVKLGQSIQGLRVIREGLSPGDRVIVSGMQRVRSDALVQAKMRAPPAPPRSSLTKRLAGEKHADASTKTGKEVPVLPSARPHSRSRSRH